MNSENITELELCNLFDHTNLKPFATKEDFQKLCKEADENNFAMVAINSVPVAVCAEYLKDSKTHVGAAISFPLGQTTIETKVFETEDAIAKGADEIDYVINIGKLKEGNLDYIKREMEAIVSVCKKNKVLSKVIFENCFLTKEEIIAVAGIAKAVGPDYIKTSTGFGTSGAIAEDVEIMKQAAGAKIKVKAAGGIRDWKTCAAMIDAGAERIGTSNSFAILEEFRQSRGL